MIEQNARDYLEQIPFWTKKKNTLAQVADFLGELGSPQRRMKLIHVAGTNGKGSVCADLTAVLVQAGYQVGTFVSPHLVDVTERFLLNGEPVLEEAFEESFREVLAVVKTMMKRGYCHPTFFEFVFLMAMALYGRENPDYVILETGLGGLYDTTNVIEAPLVCVITSISLDHTQYLGETIPEIAAQKAGIIKPGVPVVFDDNQTEASAVIWQTARKKGAPAWPVGAAQAYQEVSFAAPYQAMNAALAVKALNVLKLPGVTPEICRKALAGVRWKGRMQEVLPDVWVDGAHNPDGVRAFIQAVKWQQGREQAPGKRVQLLFAAVADKDYQEMIQLLCKELPITRVTVVHLDSERGLGTDVLADLFCQAGCHNVCQFETTKEAFFAALAEKTEEDRLYVVGSLYLAGEIEESIRRKMNAGL